MIEKKERKKGRKKERTEERKKKSLDNPFVFLLDNPLPTSRYSHMTQTTFIKSHPIFKIFRTFPHQRHVDILYKVFCLFVCYFDIKPTRDDHKTNLLLFLSLNDDKVLVLLFFLCCFFPPFNSLREGVLRFRYISDSTIKLSLEKTPLPGLTGKPDRTKEKKKKISKRRCKFS